MAGQSTFEIYTLASGRWLVDTRFKGTQRDSAIEEAKRIAAQPGIEQVKVIRETFNEHDGLIKESTVFKSELRGEGTGPAFDPYNTTPTGAKRQTSSNKRRSRPAQTDFRGRPARTRTAPAVRRTPISAPVRLAYKMFIIGLISFAFATTMTLLYNQSSLS